MHFYRLMIIKFISFLKCQTTILHVYCILKKEIDINDTSKIMSNIKGQSP